MQEHSVAIAAHEKGNRLVHQRSLDAHSISRKNDKLLPAFVQAGEGFTQAEDLLVGRETKRRGHLPAEIAGPAHKRERKWRRETAPGNVYVLRGCQELARAVAYLNLPGVFDHGDGAIGTFIGD